MKKAVIFGGGKVPSLGYGQYAGSGARVDTLTVSTGVIEADDLEFQVNRPENRKKVLVKVKGFSCNYRDKSFVHRAYKYPRQRYSPIGSEYSGEVVAVGPEVERLKIGTRVMTNHHYTGGILHDEGVLEGVVTNRASVEMQIVHESKLIAVPDGMDDLTASAFSLNAQTAYSMIRRASIGSGQKVLLTSGTSTIALFLIPALVARGALVYVATSSHGFRQELLDMGATQVIPCDRSKNFSDNELVVRQAVEIDLFDAVLDPFFDLHINRAIDLLVPYGVYCTCGLLNQQSGSVMGSKCDSAYGNDLFAKMMVRNLTLIGNCIGVTADLVEAIDEFIDGRYRIVIDSYFRESEFSEFVTRSFDTCARFGKVVFCFS